MQRCVSRQRLLTNRRQRKKKKRVDLDLETAGSTGRGNPTRRRDSYTKQPVGETARSLYTHYVGFHLCPITGVLLGKAEQLQATAWS